MCKRNLERDPSTAQMEACAKGFGWFGLLASSKVQEWRRMVVADRARRTARCGFRSQHVVSAGSAARVGIYERVGLVEKERFSYRIEELFHISHQTGEPRRCCALESITRSTDHYLASECQRRCPAGPAGFDVTREDQRLLSAAHRR